MEDIRETHFLVPAWLLHIEGLKPLDREVYIMAIDNFLNSDTDYFTLSQGELSKLLNVSKKTVMRSIKTLKKMELLIVEKINGAPNKYYFPEEVKEAVIEMEKNACKNKALDN